MDIKTYVNRLLRTVVENDAHPDIVCSYMTQAFGAVDFYARSTGDEEVFGWWEDVIYPKFCALQIPKD